VPFDLDDVLDPTRTAILLVDLQRALIGDLATNHLVAPVAEERGLLANVERLVTTGRAAGARVVHCTAEFRPDLAGSQRNSPVLAAALKNAAPLFQGSPGAEVIPALGPEPADLVVPRLHGLTPFTGTELDPLLRNLGIRTVVVAGVSVNVGVVGTCIEAVNFGYQVVVATDAVAGYPADYGDAVLANTIAFLGTLVTTDDVVTRWKRATT
jgi:nicotinamidase-related amidase